MAPGGIIYEMSAKIMSILVVVMLLLSIGGVIENSLDSRDCYGISLDCDPDCSHACCIHAILHTVKPVIIDSAHYAHSSDFTFFIPDIFPADIFQPPETSS